MAPSQLKKLKASLRESGVVGPQKSKKQKKQASKNGTLREGRIQRNEALNSIREKFAPFEVKAPVRNKFEFVSRNGVAGKVSKGVVGRPGVTKGLGEENRRRTLLPEMQRRNKVGGFRDRRFGESDPTMTPEERNLERFVREKQRGDRKASMFNLEDDELTHFGQPLASNEAGNVEDFKEDEIELSDVSASELEDDERPHKRQRLEDDENGSDDDFTKVDGPAQPGRPKTKNEVMKEVVAKSKLHKYERQQAKEDDDDLRAELDRGLPDLFALMRGKPKLPVAPQPENSPNGTMNPDRLALLNGKDRAQADKEYDERLREYTFDQRSRPTVRTLTEEEKLEQEATKLKALEGERLRRMRGDPESEDQESNADEKALADGDPPDPRDSDAFGLGSGIPEEHERKELDVEDEDDFILDDELIASDSDVDISGMDDSPIQSDHEVSEDEDREFVQGILSKEDTTREELKFLANTKEAFVKPTSIEVPFTFICPQTHLELIEISKNIAITELPTVIQRIRALYQPQLAAENKAKLGRFSAVLVDHISYLANQPSHPPFSVLEALIRHTHSLAKTFPDEIGRAFRGHLIDMQEKRPLAPTSGDLLILTAISTIFPTSDHFHQVVTPAMLCMTRYLGQKVPQRLSDLATGTYIAGLVLQYQKASKRYVPELVNYLFTTIYAIIPSGSKIQRPTPRHSMPVSLHISKQKGSSSHNRKLKFWDTIPSDEAPDDHNNPLKESLLITHLDLVVLIAQMWCLKSAFVEIIEPILDLLSHVESQVVPLKFSNAVKKVLMKAQGNLQKALIAARQSHADALSNRQPLELHHHRPLPIKTSIPKFEESYNPTSHYDPDRQRSELSKLQAEHKKERKGALRELRKDANFMAREGLREKRERDEAYEKKMRRVVSMVQGEEGHEAKEYEREKRLRKNAKRR
ncbi:MAG: hypothetical protein Q9195_001121 [Heterodermia aff. obscurata]